MAALSLIAPTPVSALEGTPLPKAYLLLLLVPRELGCAPVRVAVPPDDGQVGKSVVWLARLVRQRQQPLHQNLQSARLVDMGRDQLLWYAQNGSVPQEVRDAFARIAELRAAIDQTDRAIDEATRQRSVIIQEQERLRDNLASVPAGSDLANRYLTKLAEQEDLIEQQLARLDDLAGQRESLLQAQRDYIAGLTI